MDTRITHSPCLNTLTFRAAWISDLHLGTSLSNTGGLLEFLEHLVCERLYLVGDIIDFLHLRNGEHWRNSHKKVIESIFKLARSGTQVIYLPGNHDRIALSYLDGEIPNVEITEEIVHTTATGQRLWVTHGDQFDFLCTYAPWVTLLGDALYRGAIKGNRLLSSLDPVLNREQTINAVRQHTLTAVSVIKDFERKAAIQTANNGFDGIVCGHIHLPAQRLLYGIAYWNCGDWVKHNSAIVEDQEGGLHLIYGDDILYRERHPCHETAKETF